MVAVIMAGGKGTRIASLNKDIPKPMFRLWGKPVLEYAVRELVAQGIREIILVVGHLGSIVREYFNDGSAFGAEISYITEENPLGTAGALYFLKDKLDEDFVLLNGDVIFSIDFSRMVDFHRKKGGMATLLVHPNSHPYDSGLVQYEDDGCVTHWMTKEDERTWYRNRVNAGVHVLSQRIFSMFSEPRKTDLDRDILRRLIPDRELWAYYSTEYVKDMGTPERYKEVTEDVANGLVQRKNLQQPQRAIFLDRDGTINHHIGYITKPEQIELLPHAAEAIRMINRSGMLAIVVTNQPVVARGDCTEIRLQEIHAALETRLGEHGAYLDAIYHCPHHPDRGFPGERIEYKIECVCRKPKPGLILKAADDFHIDIAHSYMIGDSEVDVMAGRSAGCAGSYLIAENDEQDALLKIVQIILTDCREDTKKAVSAEDSS